jgi:cyclohexa-1,5-dienecarbonyl-CoA hydratase
MLATFHGLFRTALRCAVPMLAAVRGQCLGGGLELASFCHRVVVSPNAQLGQPEILLGVFAPFASFFLPERVGRGVADDLLLTGRSLGAEEAVAVGLCDQIAEDPLVTVLHYAREHLMPRSASSLRHAVAAARLDIEQRFERQIGDLERLYLEGLMKTADAQEGLIAFLEKRPPVWSHR